MNTKEIFNTIILGFKNTRKIFGRATRKEYWLTLISTYFIYFLIGLSLPLSENWDQIMENIGGFFIFFIIIPLGFRRMHDSGYSGFWLFIPIVNLIGIFSKSQNEENKWGPVPKDNDYEEETKKKNIRKLTIFKYFLKPKKKDWLFLSLIGSLYVTLFMGTTLLY